MRASLVVNTPSWLNPFLDRPSQRGLNSLTALRGFLKICKAIASGEGVNRRMTNAGGRETTNFTYGLAPAIAGVTVAAPANAATITLNGTALTAAQHRARATVTVASIQADDTLTVNGVVITGKSSPTGNYQFDSDGTDATVASAIVACINNLSTLSSDAVTAAGIYGKIRAVRPAADGVIQIYAITEGTAGNSYTIVTSNGTRLAITNDSSGSLAGGAAATNNQFDYFGTDADIARSIVTNCGLSSTAIINKHVTAACRKGIVTAATVLYADTITLDSVVLRAIKETTDSGGARVTTFPDDVFGIGASDTATGDCLVNCIHNHPRLRERFYAVNSAGAVTIRERPPEATNPPPLVTSNGTRLAVTATTNGCLADSALVLFQSLTPGHGGNAVTIASSSGTTLAIDGSATRLAGGTSTTITL